MTQYADDSTRLIQPVTTTPTPAPVSSEIVAGQPMEHIDIPHTMFGGYDRDAVDTIMDYWYGKEAEWEQRQASHETLVRELNGQINAAQQDTHRLQVLLDQTTRERDKARHDADNNLEAFGRKQQEFVNSVHADAVTQADMLVKQAQQQAANIAADTKAQADKIIASAKQQADQIVASAQHTAKQVKDTAQAGADKLTSGTKTKTQTMLQQADQTLRNANQQAADAAKQADETLQQAKQQAADIVENARREQDKIRSQNMKDVQQAQAKVTQANKEYEQVMGKLRELSQQLGGVI